MKHLLLALLFAAACGGKSAPKTETPTTSDTASAPTGDNANCVGKTGGNHNCGLEQLQLDTSSAAKVEGGGRSEDCIGQSGMQHACAYEVADLKALGGTAKNGATP
jgi:hypothetical protein